MSEQDPRRDVGDDTRPMPPAQPHLHRPYKVIGYPFVPAVFVTAACALVVNALITDPKWTSLTFGVVLAGLPVYYAWFNTKR